MYVYSNVKHLQLNLTGISLVGIWYEHFQNVQKTILKIVREKARGNFHPRKPSLQI